MRKPCVVVGSGPAWLMAAEALSGNGVKVIVCEAKPSLGRKFLMAGKSGLNITKDEPDAAFLRGFYEAAPMMLPMLAAMGPGAVRRFVEGLGQEVFTGSSGRVFPRSMKASPLLRAWLARLNGRGVEFRTRWRWVGWADDGALTFITPQGQQALAADATILALGGASWSRLGSDGAWTGLLAGRGVALHPFKPANMGLTIAWSPPMQAHFGSPVKGIALIAHGRNGQERVLGEGMISRHGLEGSGIYAVSRAIREGAALTLDILPDLDEAQLVERLERPRG